MLSGSSTVAKLGHGDMVGGHIKAPTVAPPEKRDRAARRSPANKTKPSVDPWRRCMLGGRQVVHKAQGSRAGDDTLVDLVE